jgi:chemotaxis-related protein WspB
MLLLTFTAGANRYAIDVARVVELVPRVELRTVPHAPAFLSGLLGYRGQVVPVIDLGVLLDAVPCRQCLSTRIILVNDAVVDHKPGPDEADDPARAPAHPTRSPALLGLVAEQVIDVTYTRPEQIVPAPICLPQAPYLGAIVQTDQGIVQLIVVEKLREASLPADRSGQNEVSGPRSAT